MAFRLSIWHKGKEVVACEDPTDDGVVAIWNCRQFQNQVVPLLRQNIKFFRRAKDGDFERRVERIDLQLVLGEPFMNGRH